MYQMGCILVIFGKHRENRHTKDQEQHVGMTLYILFLCHFPPEYKVLCNIRRGNAVLKGFKLYIYLFDCIEVPHYIFNICCYY